ncbi:hypothetical protein ACPOL_1321 [Acidisarcina polymorpha]|uniref:Uncharacterized protein n=1 Tax=Acidisarcina polymorpha TaxID=2211140 RepID=A0A2Z5FUV5_9BACT|nr:hypothetical protein ACPOL_1321 [Acidisarcina polymorpha]
MLFLIEKIDTILAFSTSARLVAREMPKHSHKSLEILRRECQQARIDAYYR